VLDFHLSESDRVTLDPSTTYTLSQVAVSMSSLTPTSIFFG